MHDVSVIIVSWNAKKHLVDCLNSLGNGREIIVVDNGSSEGSPEVVEKEFPQVKLIRNAENLGFARANNIGIRASTGRYVCLINSDVVVLNDCIESLVKFMDSNSPVGMAGPRILNPDRTLQVSCRHFPSIWNNLCQALGLNYVFPKSAFFSEPFMKYWAHDEIRKVDVLSGCFLMIRREAIDEVGLLDENFFIYGEDIDWCRRFHKSGWDVMLYPEAQAIHIGGASSSNAPIRFYLETQKADLQYWRKHHGVLGRFAYTFIILLRQILRAIHGAIWYVISPSERKSTSLKLKRSLAVFCDFGKCLNRVYGKYRFKQLCSKENERILKMELKTLIRKIVQKYMPAGFLSLFRRLGIPKKDTQQKITPIHLRHIRRYEFARAHLQGDTVLDAACGTGYGSDLLEPVKQYVGIDYIKHCIKYAEQNFGRTNRRFIKTDIYLLDKLLTPNSFDAIVSFETLEHLDNLERALSVFLHLLKPGGNLIMSIPLNHPDIIFHKRKYNHASVQSLFKNIANTASFQLDEYLQRHLQISQLEVTLAPDATGTWLGILTKQS